MNVNHPIAFACRLLITATFSCIVALGLTLGGKGPWDMTLAHSLPIGTLSWLSIDVGRYLLTRNSPIPWPARPWGWVLVVGGTAIGFVAGSAIGHFYTGGEWGLQALLHGHETASALVITIAASTAVSFFFHSRGKARYLEAKIAQAERDAAEARLKLLETQLEPHMMFNTLANLRMLIATDAPRAQSMLDHLIDYLRATLGASRATLHPLADEFARLGDYLELMAVRMGPRLAFTLDLPEPLRDVSVPPLLLQPLVENAIRHGLEPQVNGGHITVQARLLQQGGAPAAVQLTVRDTGIGLQADSAATRTDAAPRRFGLQQVRERLSTLYGASSTLELIAGSACGTSATITFPLKNLHHEHIAAPCADR